MTHLLIPLGRRLGFDKFPLSRKLVEIYLRIFPIRMGGFWMFMDPSSLALLGMILSDNFEVYNTEVFKRFIKEGDIVCDIGANVGYYTLVSAILVGRAGKVYSFEPAPENFSLLKKNIRINRLNNVVSLRVAISDTRGKAKLYLSNQHSWDHKLFVTRSEERDFITVRQDTIDNIFDKNKKIDFVKIDVQGLEESCLRGMQQIVKRNKNIILHIELEPSSLREAGTTPENLIRLIRNMGLSIYYLDEVRNKSRLMKHDDVLLSLAEKWGHVNILCYTNQR